MKHNLEQDIRQCPIITDKVKNSVIYSQNLYAALCNNQFQKQELIPVLRDENWCCSWRYAGGIIASIRGEGDYMDWYCSGMSMTVKPGYVNESVITPEIRKDFQSINWKVQETE